MTLVGAVQKSELERLLDIQLSESQRLAYFDQQTNTASTPVEFVRHARRSALPLHLQVAPVNMPTRLSYI